MSGVTQASPEVLKLLRHTDTCTVSNAIESFNVRMRNEGFLHGPVRSVFPALPPVAGHAVTVRIRTTAPPIANLCYYHRMDFWEYVASLAAPKLIVAEDVDRIPGTGALFGEIHARIAMKLGVCGYVTNGTVRDIPALEKARFACFALGASVSHSYAHVIEYGEPVEIGGQKIVSGDLLQGDLHGVQIIPPEVTGVLADAVADITRREEKLIRTLEAPDFSLRKLAEVLDQERVNCQPPKPH